MASFAAVAANPSYRWTGGAGVAASGDYAGTYLWSDANNWEDVDTGVNEEPAAGGNTGSSSTILDFTGLEKNATITFDSSKNYYIYSLAFGENKGTQTLAMGSSAAGQLKAFTATSGFTVSVPSGTTVDFRINRAQNNDCGGTPQVFTGGGTFRLSSAVFSTYRNMWTVNADTTLELNSPTLDLRTVYIAFASASSRLVLGADTKIGAIIGASQSVPGQISLNGHTLEYCMSFGTWVTTNDKGWIKGIKSKVWTDASGVGNLIYSGGAVYTNMMSQSVTGQVRLMNADVTMADGTSFTGSPSLDIGSGGIFTLGADQTVAKLTGEGTTGGVEIPSGKTLVVTGAVSGTTNYNATLTGAGAFVKNGGDELVLSGRNTMTGPMTIGAGTLTAKGSATAAAAETSLNHGYSFEDTLADDRVTGGKAAEFSYRVNNIDATTPPEGARASSFCEGRRGTRGVEMYSGSFASVYTFQKADTGTGPFTATFWMVPATNICLSANSEGATYLAFIGNGGGAAYNVARIYLVNGTNLNFSAGKTTNKSVVKEDGLGVATDIPWDRLYDGGWHMVTMTYSGDGEGAGAKVLSGYFDGELVGSKLLNGGTLTVTSNGRLHLGWGSKGSIAGRFDDWKYLSRCQTAEEVKAEYLGEVETGDDYAALPAPVAEWKFDDASNPGKDTSGNGYDLSPVSGFDAHAISVEGAYGKALAANSVLNWADVSNFPSKFPAGNDAWTLSVRYQADVVVEGNNSNNPSLFYWGNPTNTSVVADGNIDGRYFSVCLYNSDGYRYCSPAYKSTGYKYHTPSAALSDIMHSGIIGRFAWTHLVYVFKPGDGLYFYQDGRLSKRVSANSLNISRQDIVVGLRPKYFGSYELTPFNGNIDDIRMWDVSFSAEQVRTLVRGMKDGASPSPLSADSDVTVASGATLKVEGTGVAAKSVSGAGNLNVAASSSLTMGGGTLTGRLEGLGQINVTAPFKVASASNYFGNVVLSGSGAINAPGLASSIVLPDPYSVTLPSASAFPLVRTDGRVTLPQSLELSFDERPEDGTYLFAEAGDLDMPSDLGSWVVHADGNSVAKFVEQDGKVYLSVRGRGMIVIVR